MDDAQVGWIAAIVIGGVAGWLAEQFMKSEMGILMNIVLGVIGAAIASAILSFFGVHLGGWIGYLIAGFIGAVLLIWIVRAVQGTRRPVLGQPIAQGDKHDHSLSCRCRPIELADRRSDFLGLRGRLGWRPLSFQAKRALSAVGT